MSSLLGAVITIALLVAAARSFSGRQAAVAARGFANYRSNDPSKVCISPPGDSSLPIKRCNGLQWTCRQACRLISPSHKPNASVLASGLLYSSDLVSQLVSTPITMKFTWNWLDVGRVNDTYPDDFDGIAYKMDTHLKGRAYSDFPFLLDILSSEKCDIAESFRSSVSYADMATAVWDTFVFYESHLPYHSIHRPSYSQPSKDGSSIPDFDEVVINDANRSYTQDAFYAFWTSLPESMVARNAMFQRYDPTVNATYDDQGAPDHNRDHYHNRDQYRKQVFFYNDTAPLVLALEYDTNDTFMRRLGPEGEILRSFLRVQTRRNINFEKGDKGCYEAMQDAWKNLYKVGYQPFHAGQIVTVNPEGGQIYELEDHHILCPLNEAGIRRGNRNYNSIFDTKNPNTTDEWNSHSNPSRLLPANKVIFLSDCASLTLTPAKSDIPYLGLPHQECVPSESCTEQLVTTANLPLLNNFVSAAKTEHALADGMILNTVPMSYDDLNALYTGLLAGAVGCCVTLLASVVGLILIEVYNVHRSWVSSSSKGKSNCNRCV